MNPKFKVTLAALCICAAIVGAVFVLNDKPKPDWGAKAAMTLFRTITVDVDIQDINPSVLNGTTRNELSEYILRDLTGKIEDEFGSETIKIELGDASAAFKKNPMNIRINFVLSPNNRDAKAVDVKFVIHRTNCSSIAVEAIDNTHVAKIFEKLVKEGANGCIGVRGIFAMPIIPYPSGATDKQQVLDRIGQLINVFVDNARPKLSEAERIENHILNSQSAVSTGTE